ncbi:unnamed protein product [marine sediment metagenome]|uniref:Uncharacterized protein n=1 Tax=marine sediment metagenome TaxID=412755 RepID=X1BVZ4_9ZZZZ
MAATSGQVTVTTAGTAVQGPDIDVVNQVTLGGLSGNTGLTYAGNDGAGDVTNANGFEFDAGGLIRIEVSNKVVTNLSQLWFDCATNGDKVCWILS